ncbi:SEC-C metal-binding domain-containing protein [Aurantimonas marianensis]|uniref:SEC-C domain-containing protein n=1 Tax=Aurantimonas marianensis TaxID=2920428 RepID=A0A9X2KE51_9HYPH|nr:SEC-C metal-binding domain-containing protein [Aurantimonas marianensis]MCP3055058.1 SEC-C domain-containing protein [Aurantimonas marianensis]
MVALTVSEDLLADVQQAVAAYQPELNVTTTKDIIILDGLFVVSGPQGPFDWYQVRVGITAGFPWEEPCVVETGDRIPKVVDRHVFPDHGDCCLGVWEEWLITASDHTFEAFMTGVMHDYFVSQTYFEAKGEWPFGERSHGDAGVVESFADLLGVGNDKAIIVEYLRLMSWKHVKGHASCPCGSGRRLRQCHRDKVDQLKKRIPLALARRMFNRVRG